MIEETNKIIEKLDKTEDIVRMRKLKYKLTASDKINDISEKLDLLRTFMNVLK